MLNQIDITLLLLPLLCCLFALMSQPRQPQANIEIDSWFVPKNIAEVYQAVIEEVNKWNKKSREKKSKFSFRRKEKERFSIIKTVAPRLCEIHDRKSGPIFFEMIEVEGGGTVVKVTYNQMIKELIVNFKAHLPLKIPAQPIGKNCPSCGKSVLKEFNVCPYCGEKLTES